jgi:hypothetical protein
VFPSSPLDLPLFSFLPSPIGNNSNSNIFFKIAAMGLLGLPKATSESATNELPLDTEYGLNEMPQLGTNYPEYGQETDNADDAEIKKAHDYVISGLIDKKEEFLEEFNTIIDNEEKLKEFFNSNNFDLSCAELCQSQGRTILHRIISSVSEENLQPGIATEFTKKIIQNEPDLIIERSSLDNDMNALELAVSSQNCLGIIKAICEEGMLQEIKNPNDKEETNCVEQELGFNVIQDQKSISPTRVAYPASHKLPASAISQTEVQTATGDPAESRMIIQMNRRTFAVEINWRQLTQERVDTFLHKAILKNKNDYVRYLLNMLALYDKKERSYVLQHKGQSGYTPLHHAVDYNQCTIERVELVETMIHLCPETLAMDSAPMWPNSDSNFQIQNSKGVQKNYAPYKYFLELEALPKTPNDSVARPKKNRIRNGVFRSYGTVQPGNRPSLPDQKYVRPQFDGEGMKHLLRLSCMQYHGKNRETITDLIGKPVSFDALP